MKLPHLKPYNAARGQILDGDLVFTSGDCLLSQAIARTTESWCSHVGIVFRDHDRLRVFESVGGSSFGQVRSGVRQVLLREYAEDYSGTVVLARPTYPKGVNARDQISLAWNYIGRNYDYGEIFLMALRLGFRMKIPHRPDGVPICSELVRDLGESVGLTYPAHQTLGYITPAMLYAVCDPIVRIR